MPKIAYLDKKFNASTSAVIDRANAIITEYQGQGFTLTLRQLYYQFVARGLLPNRQTEYDRLGSIVNDARLAGLIDWEAIEDRTRFVRSLAHWDDPAEIVEGASEQFRIDKWGGQKVRPEVWIEKDALLGVFEGVCEELDVAFTSCRGYTSQSEMWRAAQRLLKNAEQGQKTVILHFGDHDPSGIDMSRDIRDRLGMFTGGAVRFDRLALNMDQVEQYSPPPNPAKMTDSRYQAYIADYGDESWELDALEPSVLAALVRTAVSGLRDERKWRVAVKQENGHRATLAAIADRFSEVRELVADE